MVLEVSLLMVTLILLVEKLDMVLGVLLAHMIKPQVEASKLVR